RVVSAAGGNLRNRRAVLPNCHAQCWSETSLTFSMWRNRCCLRRCFARRIARLVPFDRACGLVSRRTIRRSELLRRKPSGLSGNFADGDNHRASVSAVRPLALSSLLPGGCPGSTVSQTIALFQTELRHCVTHIEFPSPPP